MDAIHHRCGGTGLERIEAHAAIDRGAGLLVGVKNSFNAPQSGQ